MSDYTAFLDFPVDNLESIQDIGSLKQEIEHIDGVDHAYISDKHIKIEYNTYALSAEGVKDVLRTLGCTILEQKKEKNPFKRMIARLGESNKKTFGDAPLDCCRLNDTRKPES